MKPSTFEVRHIRQNTYHRFSIIRRLSHTRAQPIHDVVLQDFVHVETPHDAGKGDVGVVRRIGPKSKEQLLMDFRGKFAVDH